MTEDSSHNELVRRAVIWLRRSKRCGVAVPELVSYANENADAIGWRKQGMESILVECKATRRDFLSDKNKSVRKQPEIGFGDLRYYFTPAALVQPEEVPDGWGLAEVHGRRVMIIREAELISHDVRQGQIMMYSLLRRAECKGLLQRCFSPKWGGDDDFKSGTQRVVAETP